MNVVCPNCNASLSVRDEYAGKTGKCKKCNEQFTVPVAPPVVVLDKAKKKKKKTQQQNNNQTVVYVGNQGTTNSFALSSLILAIVSLVLCWIPIVNIGLCLLTLVILIVAVVICVFKKGTGLGYIIPSAILLLISFAFSFALIHTIGEVGKRSLKEFQEKDKIINNMSK